MALTHVTGHGIDTPTITGLVTLAGGQIAFPASQSASSDANTLDDYEEGTWTPVIGSVDAGTSGQTYTIQTGFYTKVGRQILATFVAQLSVKGSIGGSFVGILGLPFTSHSVNYDRAQGAVNWDTLANPFYNATLYVPNGFTYGYLFGSKSANVTSQILAPADIAATTTIAGSVVYHTET